MTAPHISTCCFLVLRSGRDSLTPAKAVRCVSHNCKCMFACNSAKPAICHSRHIFWDFVLWAAVCAVKKWASQAPAENVIIKWGADNYCVYSDMNMNMNVNVTLHIIMHDIKKNMGCALNMLNVEMAIWLAVNTNILNNTALMPFCSWFAELIMLTPKEWNHNFHCSNVVLMGETLLTAADILTMSQLSCTAVTVSWLVPKRTF